jgi:hypothetical protein
MNNYESNKPSWAIYDEYDQKQFDLIYRNRNSKIETHIKEDNIFENKINLKWKRFEPSNENNNRIYNSINRAIAENEGKLFKIFKYIQNLRFFLI